MIVFKARFAGLLAFGRAAGEELAEPRTNMLRQLSERSDRAAIVKLGDTLTAAGVKWIQAATAGNAVHTLTKPRASICPGNAR